MERLKFNFQEAPKKPIQSINDPEVLLQKRKRILEKIAKEAEKWQQFRAKSLERARVTFVREGVSHG